MNFIIVRAPFGSSSWEISTNKLSIYAAGLPTRTKERYLKKISVIGNLDPFSSTNELKFTENIPPNVSITQIWHYFVYNKSAYTEEHFLAYKSLDSYNFHISGWIKEIQCCKKGDKFIVRGKVSIFTVSDNVYACVELQFEPSLISGIAFIQNQRRRTPELGNMFAQWWHLFVSLYMCCRTRRSVLACWGVIISLLWIPREERWKWKNECHWCTSVLGSGPEESTEFSEKDFRYLF